MYRVFAVAFIVLGFYGVNYYVVPPGGVATRLGLGPFQEARQAIAGGQVHVETSGRVVQSIDRLLKRVPLRADPPVLQERVDEARIGITPTRRGEGRFESLWTRWRGPLGLAWVQRRDPLDRVIAVTPDIKGVDRKSVV